MNTESQKLQGLDTIKLPPQLLTRVMARIVAEQRLMVLQRLLIPMAVVFVAILTLAIPIWQTFQADVITSGFGQYLALGFYDFKIILTDWQDFSWSLLESLPIISTVELLTVVLGFCLTLKFLFTYGSEFMSRPRWSVNF